ncbi:predicted protein [Nematostella vectensis]|uniref:Uncharacterized protein n=1 Tax=Nematostella vectensis TaxID=45351 RepID=A7S8U5_NEMVE|nr:predicted protein [Nematostella vectensis]|eukprot:XP_001631991.1 predicted protein [Nematostella vectensis]
MIVPCWGRYMIVTCRDRDMIVTCRDRDVIVTCRDCDVIEAFRDRYMIVTCRDRYMIVTCRDRDMIVTCRDRDVIVTCRDCDVIEAFRDRCMIVTCRDRDVIVTCRDRDMFQIFATLAIFTTIILPCLRAAYDMPVTLWTCFLPIVMTHQLSANGSFLAVFIFINNSVPSELLGTVNGLSMAVTSVFRALAPSASGSLFAWSISEGYKLGFPFNVNLAFIFLGLIRLLSVVFCCFLSQDLNKQKIRPKARTEDTALFRRRKVVETTPVWESAV